MSKVKAEYIWMDGHEPTQKLRSKTKVVHNDEKPVLEKRLISSLLDT